MFDRLDKNGGCDHAILIDFQMVNVGRPFADLHYLIGCSTYADDMRDHLNSWLRLYHQVLTKSLMAFGYPETLYTFSSLKEDFDRSRYHGFTHNVFRSSVSLKI